MLEFDARAARHIQRLYSTPDIVAQRAEVLALLAPRPGEAVLDVGSGPGFLVASIAAAVAPEGVVHGVDPSPAMNALAREQTAGSPGAHIDEGDASALPYPDARFDAAVSTQVYEYVTDVPAALTELHRVLRPGGRVLILDTDWDSLVWHAADRALQDRIMAAWAEHLADPHLPRTLSGHLRRSGFRVTGRAVIPLFNPTHEAETFSAMTIRTIADFVVGRQGVSQDDVDAWAADLRARAAEDDYLFSVNRYCFTAVAR